MGSTGSGAVAAGDSAMVSSDGCGADAAACGGLRASLSRPSQQVDGRRSRTRRSHHRPAATPGAESGYPPRGPAAGGGARGAGDVRRVGRRWSTNVPSRHSHARRTGMSKAIAGLVVALTLGVGLAVGAVAGGLIAGNNATPSPLAVASATTVPTPSPSAPPTEPPSASEPATAPPASPSVEPSPSVAPSPTPEPSPSLVPAPLTGRLVTPATAARHVIAVMIDDQLDARPQSGLSSASVVWQAPAEGGIPRYMALFQGATRRRSAPCAARASTSSRGRPSGGPCTSTSAARRRRSRSSTRRRAAAPRCSTPTGSATRGATCGGSTPVPRRQRVHGCQAPADDGAGREGEARRVQAGMEVRARQAPGRPAEGRHDRRPLPGQQDHVQVRPQDEHVPAHGHRRRSRPTRGTRGASRPRTS